MKWVRKTYWYTSAFISKRWRLIVGVLLFSAVVSYLSLSFLLSPARLKPTRYIGRVGLVTIASLPLEIQQMISVGLTSVDATGAVFGAAAQGWTISDDNTTYSFQLRDDLSWHDGRALAPADIPYSFAQTTVEIEGKTITYKLKEPFSPFLSAVSQPMFREDRSKIVGLGTYKVRSVQREGARISELTMESPAEFVVFRFYSTEEAAVTAMKSGQVDELQDINSDGGFTGWPLMQVEPRVRMDRYIAIYFNTENPVFDRGVRQALNYALSKPTGDSRAKTPIHPDSWAYNKTVKNYEQDMENAVSLLVKNAPPLPMQFQLATVPAFQDMAEQMKAQWEALGIQARDACLQTKTVKEKTSCENLIMRVDLKITNLPDTTTFDALLIAQQIPGDPDQYFLWHSTQPTNFTKYKSPRIDKLLEDGRKTVDETQRKTIYQDFQQYLVEDSPAIFLEHPVSYYIRRTQIL